MIDLKNKIRKEKGITLIALIITVVVITIIASIIISVAISGNGLIDMTITAKDENVKGIATETINLKITKVEMTAYIEKHRMPTLKELADNFCEDEDFDKVIEKTEVGSLTKITNENPTAIIAKLKQYPYEFEIDNQLRLASIDGIKVADNSNDGTVTLTQSQYNSILERLTALENNSNVTASNNYSTSEQVVGTWIDGKPLYRKVIVTTVPECSEDGISAERTINITDLSIENVVTCRCIIKRTGEHAFQAEVPVFTGDHPDRFCRCYINFVNNSFLLKNAAISYNNLVANGILEYTKTTDPTPTQ